jgi:hypothetical protein
VREIPKNAMLDPVLPLFWKVTISAAGFLQLRWMYY